MDEREKRVLELIKNKNFPEALKLLKKLSDEELNNYKWFYYKGVVNILLENIDDALLDLGETLSLNPYDIDTMNAISYVFLKKEDIATAINKWIKVKEIDPKNPIANKMIEKFKKTKAPIASLVLNPYDFIKLPEIKSQEEKKPKKKKKSKNFLFKILITIILISPTLLLFIKNETIDNLKKKIKDFIPTTIENIKYTLSQEEIEFIKKQIFEHVGKNEYNQAVYLINKVYFSNASIEDKKLVKIWESRLIILKPEKLDKNFDIDDVIKTPYAFENCYVLWDVYIENVEKYKTFSVLTLQIKDKKVKGIYLKDDSFIGKTKIFGKIRSKENNEFELEISNLNIK
ncbi:MAG TPA: hypothetical protein PKW55_07560 [Spirochaetota bacterium]|nr:hypothetical protein [Spirochaetota bacterium]HOM38562.1 hypothetical protein [Spirochaetota bacterium]HPQ49699.1 hypothetical protein [Spirochaetota bacterium]